jgi:hypothetical protein
MKHATDMAHPILDEFASQYFERLPVELWESVGVEVDISAPRGTWWTAKPEIRTQLREVATKFINGDERLAIWRLKAGRDGPGLLG